MTGKVRRFREMAGRAKTDLLGTGNYAVLGGDEEEVDSRCKNVRLYT